MESVEGVEKLFLNLFHFADELDVVDNQKVILAIFFLKRICFIALQRVYKISRKFLQGHVMHFFVRIFVFN